MKTTTKLWAAMAAATLFLGMSEVKAQTYNLPSGNSTTSGYIGTSVGPLNIESNVLGGGTSGNITFSTNPSTSTGGTVSPNLSLTPASVLTLQGLGYPNLTLNATTNSTTYPYGTPSIYFQLNGTNKYVMEAINAPACDNGQFGIYPIGVTGGRGFTLTGTSILFGNSCPTIGYTVPYMFDATVGSPSLLLSSSAYTLPSGSLLGVNGAATIGAASSTNNNLTVNGGATIYASSAPFLTIESSTSTASNTTTWGVANATGSYSAQAGIGDAVLRIAAGNAALPQTATSANNLFITNQTGGNINFSTGTATGGTYGDKIKMQLNGNGHLGIGTDFGSTSPIVTPVTELDIRTSTQNGLNIAPTSTSGNSKVEITFGDQTNTQKWAIGNNVGGSTSGNFNTFYIWNANPGTGNVPFSINPTGQVSIGTARPLNSPYTNYALAVYGSIVGTTAYILDPTLGTNWGDYVFDEDYKLTPLKEVEAYVKANHHLSEVPSKQEVMEKGVNLGEMDMILLKKVEELTLHMIEMEKKIDTLQKENKELKNNTK